MNVNERNIYIKIEKKKNSITTNETVNETIVPFQDDFEVIFYNCDHFLQCDHLIEEIERNEDSHTLVRHTRTVKNLNGCTLACDNYSVTYTLRFALKIRKRYICRFEESNRQNGKIQSIATINDVLQNNT